jgi:molybdopterin-guanine dinucleotide biosynthesis protein
MKIVAVVGSGSNSGKTTLVCRILRDHPGLGALKLSPREGVDPRIEWGPGADPEKDTARFSASGAAKVGRIVGERGRIPHFWESVRPEFSGLEGVVVEGGGSLSFADEVLPVFVLGGSGEKIGQLLDADANSPVDPILVINQSHGAVSFGNLDDTSSHFSSRSQVFTVDLSSDDPAKPLPLLKAIERFLKRRTQDGC